MNLVLEKLKERETFKEQRTKLWLVVHFWKYFCLRMFLYFYQLYLYYLYGVVCNMCVAPFTKLPRTVILQAKIWRELNEKSATRLTTMTMKSGGRKILKKAALFGRDIWNRNANRETPSSRNGLYLKTAI